jgi:hypothetical protein
MSIDMFLRLKPFQEKYGIKKCQTINEVTLSILRMLAVNLSHLAFFPWERSSQYSMNKWPGVWTFWRKFRSSCCELNSDCPAPNTLVTILTMLSLLCMYTLKGDVRGKLSFISCEYESVLEWKPF